MKKTLLITLLVLLYVASFAQDGGAPKFLGIPIDGSETLFVSQLKSKGFTYNSTSEAYKGQFNGRTVDVYVHTNHNLVDRVYVAFPYTSESNILVDYNRLLAQFKDNAKYLDLVMNEAIPEDEDISYEITVHNKRYSATFHYFDPDADADARGYALIDKFQGVLPDSTITELKSYMEDYSSMSEEAKALQTEGIEDKIQKAMGDLDEDKALLFLVTFIDGMRSLADGEVWFMIHEAYGKYQIGLYYDNLHNKPHGEDL